MGLLKRVKEWRKDEVLEDRREWVGGVLGWKERRDGEERESFEVGFRERGRGRREV